MYYIIANPSSHSGNAKSDMLKKLETSLKEADIPFITELTKCPGDARRIAMEITASIPEGKEPTIIVLGGDGSINETLNGIQDFSKIRFGFIPVGSSNDLARGLGIPDLALDAQQTYTLTHLTEGKVVRTMDLGKLHYDQKTTTYSRLHPKSIPEDQIFAVSAGIGFDAMVCEEALASDTKTFLNKLGLGKLTYGALAIKKLATAPNVRCDITIDDKKNLTIDNMIFAAFMNTPYEGGGYKFAPDASPSDGFLNFACVGNMSKLRALSCFPAAHDGSYYNKKGVTHFMGKKFRLETNEPQWVHTDGEVALKSSAITVEILPTALKMIV